MPPKEIPPVKTTTSNIGKQMNDFIVRTIKSNKGKPVNEIRRTLIQRAPADFKQGRNQRMWEDRLNAACRELDRWPKAMGIALLVSLVLQLPASANQFDSLSGIKLILPDGTAYTKDEIRLMPDEELAKHYKVLAPKTPFKVKHPVAYRRARKARTVCIFITPIVKFGGAVAQIVTAIR